VSADPEPGTVPSVPERSEGKEGTVPAESGAEAVEHDLDELVADLRKERDEYLDLAQRARADFENYRKRAARDVSDAERRGKASVGHDLVGVADNLERALIAAGVSLDPADNPADPRARQPDSEEAGGAGVSPERALIQGVALVYRELRAALQRAGIEAYDPAGERFDPEWHEALSTKPDAGVESGTVVETLQKGYRLDGLVLRPARVVVAG
jgi:molecular chaperone GrpE